MADGDIVLGPAPDEASPSGDIPLGTVDENGALTPPAPDVVIGKRGAYTFTAPNPTASKSAEAANTTAPAPLASSPIGTTVVKGLSHLPGTIGDVRDTVEYLMSRAQAPFTGIPSDQFQQDLESKRKTAQDYLSRSPVISTLAAMNPIGAAGMTALAAPSGQDISKPIFQKYGEYKPQNDLERMLMMAGEAGIGMIGPGAIAKLSTIKKGADALAMARAVLGGGAKSSVAGAGIGTASDVVSQATGDPLYGLGIGALLGAGAPYAGASAKSFVKPFVPSMRPGAARETLAGAASNPQQIAGMTRTPARGETLGEATLDPGILRAERLASGTSEDFQKTLAERDIAREQRRQEITSGLAPEADPMEVSRAYVKHLSDVEAEQEAAYNTAQARAKTGAADIQGVPSEEVGKSFREEASATKASRQKALGNALDALDPDGKLNAVAMPITDEAAAIRNAPNRDMSPLTPLAEEMVKRAELLGPVEPFNRIRALDQALTKAMRKAKNSDDEGYSDIVRLKSAVKNAYRDAAENQVKWEQQAVARGEMKKEGTFAHRLEESVESHYADRAREDARESAAGDGSLRAGNVSQSTGTRGGPGTEGSGEGLPTPNLTPETAQRLAQANKDYGEFRSLYDAEPLKGILKEKGFKSQYSALDADVLGRAFPQGEKGYEAASRALEGTGNSPQALADMKSYAVSKLRSEMKGDVLKPSELAAWKKKYAPALRALDEQSPGFSDKFNNAASATKVMERAAVDRVQAVNDARKGIAGKFLNLTSPSEVGGTLMGMIRSVTGPTQIKQFASQVGEAGLAGGRHAVAQEITRLTPNEMKNLINDHGAALTELFGQEGGNTLKSLAAEQERIQQAIRLQVGKTGSNTFDKFMAGIKRLSAEGHQTTLAGAMGVALGLGFERAMEGNIGGAAAVVGGAAFLGLVRAMRARGLHSMKDLMEEGLTDPSIGKAMIKQALDEKGNLNAGSIKALTEALRASATSHTLGEDARAPRASGGKVEKVDYAKKAAELIRLAEKAKKAHGKRTESFLKLPDSTIATALKLANQGL